MSGRRRSRASPGTATSGVPGAPWLLPLVIVAAAAAVRLAVLGTLWDLPLVRTPKLDSAEYLAWAQRLASGDGAWPVVAQHGPGYPLFLAVLLAIGSGSIRFALAVQAILGGLTATGVATLARRLDGNRAAWLAGVVYAVYGPVVYIETALLGEGLLLFLLTMALVCLTRPRLTMPWTAAAGVALGAAVLVRPTATLIAGACFVWLLRGSWRERSTAAGGIARQRAAILIVAVAAVVAPVVAKNWSASGSPSIQGYGGLNFYIGNSPLHEGRPTFRLGGGWDALNSEAPRAGIGDPLAQDRYYLTKTWQEIGRFPGRFARLLAVKSAWTIQAEEVRDSHALYFFTSQSVLLRALPGFGVVFPIACAGLLAVCGWRRRFAGADGVRFDRDTTILLALYSLAAAASVILLVVGLRYRMPLVPVVAVLAGAGGEASCQAITFRRNAALTGYVAAVVAAIVASHTLHDARNTNIAEEWALTGSSLITERKLAEAESAYRRALQLDSNLGLGWDGLGLALYDAGRLGDAAPAFERALQIDPDNARATFHLALTRERNGALESAAGGYARALGLSPFDAEIAGHLGEVQRKQAVQLGMAGKTVEARDLMQLAVERLPGNGEAWLDLCLLSLDLGDRDGASMALQRARENGASAERIAFAAGALAK